MSITHSYDLSGITSRPTDERINEFINKYPYILPLKDITGNRFHVFGSSSPMTMSYNEETKVLRISATTVYTLNPNGNTSSFGIYYDTLSGRDFTTKVGEPNTVNYYFSTIKGVGDQLLQPEAGWKRYDDAHPAIKYEGNWRVQTSTVYWGGNETDTNVFENKATFKFLGTMIRLVGRFASYNGAMIIEVDGVTYEANQRAASTLHQVLTFDLTGLDNKIHEVTIKKKDNDQSYIMLDAVDINEDGMLLHPDEVIDIKDLEVGKRIRCHYTAQSGQVGVFSNLGKETYKDGINDFIPPASTATPDGSFYLIMVGRDRKGNPKLIADRNIQHSISWDTLNNSGIASRNGVILRPTLNPVEKGTVTLDSNNTVATFSNNLHAVRGLGGKDSGKWYWEVEVLQNNSTFYIGVDDGTETVTHHGASSGNDKQRQYGSNGAKGGSVYTAYGATFSEGDVIGIALDLDSNEISFYKNGVSQGVAFDDLETMSKPVYPRIGKWASSGSSQVRLNLGQYPFKYTIPEGYYPHSFSDEEYKVFTRLLTGGTTSTDKDNEWDEYIVNSTLNETIVAGDNEVWNWNVTRTSWTSTTPSGVAGDRKVVRGNNISAGSFNYYTTNRSESDRAFRPLFIIESLTTVPEFEGGLDRTEFHKEPITLTGTLTHDKPLKYKVQINGEDITSFTSLQDPPIELSHNFTYDMFKVGANTITISTEDEEGETHSINLTATLTNLDPFGTFEICCDEITRQDVVIRGIVSNLEGGWKLMKEWDGEGEVFIRPIDLSKFK